MRFAVFGVILLFTEALCLTPLDYIDDEYKPIVNQTAFKILDALTEESTRIARSFDRIEDSTSESERSVCEELLELREYVDDSVDEANEDGYDITSCANKTVDAIDITAMDGAFNRCKRPPLLKHLINQKISLGKISAALPVEVNVCIYQEKHFGSDLRQCLNYRVFQIDRRIDQISTTVTKLVGRIEESSLRCESSAMEKFDRKINKIAAEFEECAKTILDLGL